MVPPKGPYAEEEDMLALLQPQLETLVLERLLETECENHVANKYLSICQRAHSLGELHLEKFGSRELHLEKFGSREQAPPPPPV